MDIEHIKQMGIRAVFRGGEALKRHFGKLTAIRKKGIIDLVTEADVESERIIIETLKTAFPDHSILAEESGSMEGRQDERWIIDPLDGTTNFAHGLSIFAVSLAFFHQGTPTVGIVFNPLTAELFTAVRNQGAWLNDQAIQVSHVSTVRESLLVTGFPYNLEKITSSLMHRFQKCLPAAQGVRRLGSAALDLCYVACGRFEGFWEENLKPWDTAAGMLIAQESGGCVTDFSGQPYDVEKLQILATNGHIHAEMLTLLNIEDHR